MQESATGLSLKAQVKIRKYAEGQDITIDTPFEIVTHEVTFVGAEAQEMLKQIGGVENVTN